VADGCQIIILGAKKDTAISSQIIAIAKNITIIDTCGKTNLADTVDLLNLSKYVISNDSGLMHIASAVLTNVIAIYGSSSPQFTPPLTTNATILQIKLDCSPCFARTCRFGHYNCLGLITPDMVYAKIRSV
jgi:heptosyltransferase-2